MSLDYLRTLPWLVLTTILVGLLAGMYPAWLITRASPIDALRDSVAEGWQHLRESAANALTRFRPSETSQLPDRSEVDDPFYPSLHGWSMLGGEVFEDDKRVVVRLEVPGLDKQDLSIEVHDDTLVLSGEKRFERESSEGRWRVMQCAYGTFRRTVQLPSAIAAERSKATYHNGVLRVELPKVEIKKPKVKRIPVA
jgi:HSP20 family protein